MASPGGAVRAHGGAERQNRGSPGVLGIRREDKNKWERRAPMAPNHVRALVGQGIRIIVQPSTRRVFTDDEYRSAGAEINEDLSECATICAVKEVPVDLLLPGRTWLFFSHTIKAQPAGMPLLDAALERKVRLVDYECITKTGNRRDQRLVAFGHYAGYAGAIDFLRGLGERFLALGFSTPLLHIGSAFMYPSLAEARRAVELAGEAIQTRGLPLALCPFTAVFTGSGKVTNGALDIFKLLPHEMVAPRDLAGVCSGHSDSHKLYISIATAEDMVRRRGGGPFDKAEYYAEPEKFEPIFKDIVLPHSTVIINGMYWDQRFPKLFTREDLHEHVVAGHDRLLGVCDITCDADGSVPTRQFTSIEQPFFVFNALTEKVSTSLDDPGVLFHAVDHLPSELPREASEHFGDCLLPFLPDLAHARDSEELSPQIRGAIIAEGGRLAPDFRYIDQLRSLSGADADDAGSAGGPAGLQAHGVHGPPACATLEMSGHIFDTNTINRVCDVAESAKARLHILSVDVGTTAHDESFLSVLVMAQTEEHLKKVEAEIEGVAAEAKVALRRVGPESRAKSAQARGGATLQLAGPKREVLVLGAGFVSGPLVEYLLRRPENSLTVASAAQKEVEVLVRRFGSRVRPEVVDIASTTAEALAATEALVCAADIVVSLVPASLHVGIARLAIKHQKHMVTASYVSPEMQALDDEARAAGVLIMNEAGLDPGIDHMSAMKMIDEVKASEGHVVSFSSLCGGLPAPEAVGASPLGYKFSWSPKGVLLAARNAARWRQDGELREVPGDQLLSHSRPLTLNNAFALDVLPNRDSTTFAELYGISDAPTFFRGTLRYRGFCERMLALAHLGLLEPGPSAALAAAPGQAWPLCRWLAQHLGLGAGATRADLEASVREALAAQRLGPEAVSTGAGFVAWLGLTGDGAVPAEAAADSPVDVVAQLLQRAEMAYLPEERDMVVMQHELVSVRRDGAVEKRVGTLIEYGIPRGATAMSRTVGLAAAICAQLLLDGPAERFGTGVQRPVRPEWYAPVLAELAAEGIRMEERTETIAEAPMANLAAAGAGEAGAMVSRL